MALSLARPGFVIVFVFEVQAGWTDLLEPLI
jgi:ABC-type glycerol-3-phosphate transport system permease component